MNYNLEEDNNSCKNCGECQCFCCTYREYNVSRNYECNRCDNGCDDTPMEGCNMYKFTSY